MSRSAVWPAVCFLFLSSRFLAAADWPLARGDAARSGAAAGTLPAELFLRWKYEPAHAPQPAWPRDDRMRFDRAQDVVIAAGALYFGSSADDKLYALDAASGGLKWTFFTDGPVRFAPALWQDRVYVVSDDGYLYCLAAADGSLLRKWRGGPADDRVLGNGRIVSRWPARGGPVILDGVLYWAAGIWQSEGVFIHALDLASGEVVWTNDDSGGITMPQPHGTAVAKSGVTAQGYLVATAEQILVPTGRAVPAAFRRADGAFQFYHLQQNGHVGGTPVVAAGPFFYNGGFAFEARNGQRRTALGPGAVAVAEQNVIVSGPAGIRALRPVEKTAKDRRGNALTVLDHDEAWSIDGVAGGTAVVVAGKSIVVSHNNSVRAVDLESKSVTWSTEVDGVAYGLAVADGSLFVSTDAGSIYCYGGEAVSAPALHKWAAADAPYGDNAQWRAAAEEIVAKTGIRAGYCVDLGCGDGRLAYELARRSDLAIYAVDDDPTNVAVARRNLAAAGLYGVRVTVHLGDPAKTTYPSYFADLVVSGRSVAAGAETLAEQEMARLQRPYGGKTCVGRPGEMAVSTRGPLAGAGSWSHQYGNAANTICSADKVRGPLKMLWFRDVDLEMPSRHGRGPAPLLHEGRVFAEGLDALRAVDAYNGRTLWEFPLPGILHAYSADHIVGVSQTGSNFCVAGDCIYVQTGPVCYRLDAATGKVLGKFTPPERKDGKPGRWGYIACEGGILFGTVVDEQHIVRHAWKPADEQMKQLFTESPTLFALDAGTGQLLWRYDAEASIRHNAIAIGAGRVFLIDRPPAERDLLALARRGDQQKPLPEQPTGQLVALDARTGAQLWRTKNDIFGTMLAFSAKYDRLLMCYQATRFRLPSELGRRMAVFNAKEGARVWDKQVRTITRPLINDRVIYAQGDARDLLTGEPHPFRFERSYGCGQISGSSNLLLFRSATLGYYDLARGAATDNYGGVRPGCWINALPAGGLVLLPDATAQCTCSYQNRSWVALEGAE